MKKGLDFYIALQGGFTPDEYIRYGKLIEANGFSRLYVYDDLMFYPSFPILSLIAANTSKIELGPCLVNGLYRHPALIASNAAFLDTVSQGRSVIGLGRGAFFDFLKMKIDEKYTRDAFKETVQLTKHLLEKKDEPFKGKIFNSTKKAVLRIPTPAKPYLITATWNPKMARIGGKYTDEVQLAEVFTESYLQVILKEFKKGVKESENNNPKHLSIGGMVCVANDQKKAIETAKKTLAIYIPYLKTILKNNGVNINSKLIKDIDDLSKHGDFEAASILIPNDYVEILTLSGTPDDVAQRIKKLVKGKPIKGVLISPPYSIFESMEENINYLSNELIPKLK